MNTAISDPRISLIDDALENMESKMKNLTLVKFNDKLSLETIEDQTKKIINLFDIFTKVGETSYTESKKFRPISIERFLQDSDYDFDPDNRSGPYIRKSGYLLTNYFNDKINEILTEEEIISMGKFLMKYIDIYTDLYNGKIRGNIDLSSDVKSNIEKAHKILSDFYGIKHKYNAIYKSAPNIIGTTLLPDRQADKKGFLGLWGGKSKRVRRARKTRKTRTIGRRRRNK